MAATLRKSLRGRVLSDAFSNNPDELILVFTDMQIRMEFESGEIWFFFGEELTARSRLYRPQFAALSGREVTDVITNRFERSFQIAFAGGDHLFFKCHGRRSDILQISEGKCTDSFRRLHGIDENAAVPLSSVLPEDIGAAAAEGSGWQKKFPFLPQEFIDELMKDPVPRQAVQLCERYGHLGGLAPGTQGEELTPVFSGDGLLRDLSRIGRDIIREKRFRDTRQRMLAELNGSIADKKEYLKRNRIALDELLNKRSDEEIGNIILSHVHLIPAGSRTATLQDIYRGGMVEVRLDEKLSAVENAERYFRKAKGEPHAIALLKEKIAKAAETLRMKEEELERVNGAVSWKDLKPLIRVRKEQHEVSDLPYRRFTIGGFEVLVGKNAVSNERILSEFSDKDDIWMHARDISGSHVLIRTNRQQTVPGDVMEKAAGLAAWYSKNRRQGLAAVAWTQRKYVRKIKGAEKGKVSVSQEKTLLVKPLSPGDISS